MADFISCTYFRAVMKQTLEQYHRLGKELGFKLPGKIHIFAVKIIEDQVFSRSFTSEIEKKYPAILAEVDHFIVKLTSIKETTDLHD